MLVRGKWKQLENVDQTHLVPASGKPVIQKSQNLQFHWGLYLVRTDEKFKYAVHESIPCSLFKIQMMEWMTIFVNAENQTLGRCVRIKNAASVPCSPTASASNI